MLTIRDYFGTFNSTALGLFSLELYLNDFKLENTPYIFPQIITIKAQKIDYPLSFKQVPVTTEIDVIQDIDIVLFSQLEAVTFNPEDGLSVNTTSGASVTVPPNMGFKDGNGNVVSTPVKAEVAAIDPATTNLDELPVKLQTTNGEPLQSFGLINPSFKDENGYNIVPNNEIEISVPNQDVPDLNLYGATPNGDLEEVPGGNTRKKRQATGNIVYKIGAEYIGKWLSISKAFKQPLCYAKMRVFTNSTFSTQVTDGQISFLPVVIMKVFKGTSMSGYTRNIKGTDAPSQDCYAVRCSTNTTTIKGEITLHGGKLVTKPIPPNDPALPMELDASLTNLNYKIDSGKRIASLIFNTTTDGPLFKNKTVCESAPKEKSLWFALPTQQPAEVNFGDEVCYARIILRFKSKKKKKSSSTKTPNFDLFATSFPSNARSIVNLNDMPIMAVSNTFSACARYTCSKSGANTTVAWYILPTSDFTFGCGKIIPLTPPVINATTSGYYYGTDEITVKAACQNETSMSLGFARSVVCKWRPKITK